jgi:hypothetical protein
MFHEMKRMLANSDASQPWGYAEISTGLPRGFHGVAPKSSTGLGLLDPNTRAEMPGDRTHVFCARGQNSSFIRRIHKLDATTYSGIVNRKTGVLTSKFS